MFDISTYFDISSYEHKALFDGVDRVWEALGKIKEYIGRNLTAGIDGEVMAGAIVADDVYIGEGSVIEQGVYIKGPTIIGKNCEIRHGAYIRGNCIIGDNCVVGHDSEMKSSVLLDGAKVPHFAYVGDSIVGNGANLGAGTKISNFKITKDEVNVITKDGKIGSGLRKFGAIIGDNVQTGCNTVLNPGTLIGRNSMVYALSSIRGVIPPETIVKLVQSHEMKKMRL